MRIAVINQRLSLIRGTGAVDVQAASGGRFGPDAATAYERWAEFTDWAASADLPDPEPLPPTPLGLPLPPTGHTDWEVELVVIIGRTAVSVPAGAAWEHVAGLSIGQDVSERILQLASTPPQFSLGKSYPGFGPVGPYLVTADEVDNPADLELSCSINGEQVQKSRTGQ